MTASRACRPSSRATRSRIAHLDIDRAEINKVKRVHWSHVGLIDARCVRSPTTASDSGFARDCSAWHAELAALKRTYAMNYDRASELIQPYYVIEEINRLTRGEAIITTGVGQHQMWAAQYFDFRTPAPVAHLGQHGHHGLRPAGRHRRAVRRPQRLVIDIDGDASIRMNIGELETVTTYDLPVKVVVLNNFGDGMVKQWQKLFLKGRLSASDKSAAQEGFRQGRAGRRLQLRRAPDQQGRRAARGRRVHQLQGPGVPRGHHRPRRRRVSDGRPGPGYDEMITGDFIPSRNKVDIKTPGASEMF